MVQDFDPEDAEAWHNQSGSDSDSDSAPEQEAIGRAHYQAVGKSKLRQPAAVELNAQKYGGKAVSRATLEADDDDNYDPIAHIEDDEDDDPFAVKGSARNSDENHDGLDATDVATGGEADAEVSDNDEIDSDDAFGEGEEDAMREKGFVFRGSGRRGTSLGSASAAEDSETSEPDDASSATGESVSDSQVASDMDIDASEDEESNSTTGSENDSRMMDDDDNYDVDDDDDDDDNIKVKRKQDRQTGNESERSRVKALLADSTAVASSLFQAVADDAKKGRAIRQQYHTFDRLLDARIKLQKGLTASNELVLEKIDDEAQAALHKAEEAALKLYNTLESFRINLLETVPSSTPAARKRRRTTLATTATPTSDLWQRMSDLESHSLPSRRATLDKWSSKTRAAAPLPASSRLSMTAAPEPKLTRIMDEYLSSKMEQLISQSTAAESPPATTSTPGTANGMTPEVDHLRYTDTPFYQSLLRDLLASKARLTSSSSMPGGQDTLPGKLLHNTKRANVDTKASKGRKVRYTVHDKLQNFMAARGYDALTWTDAATTEFFGSLMGLQRTLEEDNAVAGGGEGMGDGDAGEEALRFFR